MCFINLNKNLICNGGFIPIFVAKLYKNIHEISDIIDIEYMCLDAG